MSSIPQSLPARRSLSRSKQYGPWSLVTLFIQHHTQHRKTRKWNTNSSVTQDEHGKYGCRRGTHTRQRSSRLGRRRPSGPRRFGNCDLLRRAVRFDHRCYWVHGQGPCRETASFLSRNKVNLPSHAAQAGPGAQGQAKRASQREGRNRNAIKGTRGYKNKLIMIDSR